MLQSLHRRLNNTLNWLTTETRRWPPPCLALGPCSAMRTTKHSHGRHMSTQRRNDHRCSGGQRGAKSLFCHSQKGTRGPFRANAYLAGLALSRCPAVFRAVAARRRRLYSRNASAGSFARIDKQPTTGSLGPTPPTSGGGPGQGQDSAPGLALATWRPTAAIFGALWDLGPRRARHPDLSGRLRVGPHRAWAGRGPVQPTVPTCSAAPGVHWDPRQAVPLR